MIDYSTLLGLIIKEDFPRIKLIIKIISLQQKQLIVSPLL